jgi:hypothetical protein
MLLVLGVVFLIAKAIIEAMELGPKFIKIAQLIILVVALIWFLGMIGVGGQPMLIYRYPN